MVKETRVAALITVVVIVAISAFRQNNGTMFDATGGMGVSCFLLGLIAGVTGLFLSAFRRVASYGLGMVIGSGILSLIGYGLCSSGFGLIK